MKLTVERMTYGPDAIAHDETGKTVFISGGIAGDTVEAAVVSEGKSFSKAKVERVLTPSADRTEPPCPYVGVCGGCPWAALERPAQLAAKEANVRDALARIGRFSPEEAAALVQPIRYAADAWGYRNKIELAPRMQGGRLTLGLHAAEADTVVKVKRCPLFEKRFAKAVAAVQGALAFATHGADLGIERVGIRASRRTRQLEVAFWTPAGPFPRAEMSRVLRDAVKPTSVVRVMTSGDARARRVKKVEVLDGFGNWTERIGEESMTLSAPSFFQVNTPAAEILIELVTDALAPKPHEVALDLYCGAGTFTLPLARRAGFVFGVESYGPAVRDLRRNLDRARLDNVEAVGGDAAREFPDEEPDVLVVDPPRAGLAPEVVELISGTAARDVAYVSCDPATLARDLARFRERGVFRPVSVTPVDLFPQTFHVETVTHLTRA